MSDVQVIVNAVDNASKVLKGVQGEITKTGKAGQAASGNLSGMSKATAGLGGQMNGLATALAGPALGFMGLTGAVMGTVNLIKSSVNDWVAYNEEIRKLGAATGTSTEDLSRLMQAADDVGVSMEAMRTAMVYASKNGVKPTIENIAKLSDSLLSITDTTERSKEMTRLFGRGYAEVAGFVLQGSDAIRESTAAINDNLVVTSKSAQAARDYALSVDNLQDSFTGLKNELAQKVLPTLTKFMDDFSGESQRSLDEVSDSLIKSGASWSEYQKGMVAAAKASGLMITANDKLTQVHSLLYNWKTMTKLEYDLAAARVKGAAIAREYLDVSLITNGAYKEQAAVVSETTAEQTLLNYQLMASSQYAEQSAASADRFAQSWGSVGKKIVSAADAAKKMEDALRSIPTNLSSDIENDLKALNFKESGAGFVASLREGVLANLDKGLITQSQAETALQGLFIAFEAVKVKAGELTTIEAWNNVKEKLKEWGLSADEAKQIFDKLLGFDGKQISMTALVNLIGKVQGMGGVGGGGQGAQQGTSTPGRQTPQMRARGGTVNPGVPYIVGELGPELFVPSRGGQIIPNSTINNSFSMTVNNPANTNNVLSDFRLMQALAGA